MCSFFSRVQQIVPNDDSDTEDDSESDKEETDGEQQVEKLVVDEQPADSTPDDQPSNANGQIPDPSKPTMVKSEAIGDINCLVENLPPPAHKNNHVVKLKEKSITQTAGNCRPEDKKASLTLPSPGLQDERHGQDPRNGGVTKSKVRVKSKPHDKEWPKVVGDYQSGVQQDMVPRQCSDVDISTLHVPDIAIPK